MKKSFLITIFIFIIFSFSTTVYAAQKTELPANLVYRYALSGTEVTFTINSFEVTDISRASDTKTRVEFDMDYTENDGYAHLYLIMNCYDASGYIIDSLDFDPSDEYVDISPYTATIEITFENPGIGHESYVYRNYVNVYSADGRVMTITDLLVPIYETVGWSRGVTVYAPDENGVFTRSLEISPYQVDAYESVGWYTWAKTFFHSANQLSAEYKAKRDYESIFILVDFILPIVAGTKYEQAMYVMRTEAMDLWRAACGRPIGVGGYQIDKNSDGYYEVIFSLRNISYKKILAYKVKFDCYNIFGEYVPSYYEYCYNDDADLAVADFRYDTYVLDDIESLHSLHNVRIVEVVFEDGTKWYGQ